MDVFRVLACFLYLGSVSPFLSLEKPGEQSHADECLMYRARLGGHYVHGMHVRDCCATGCGVTIDRGAKQT